jgi:hypothetical protein
MHQKGGGAGKPRRWRAHWAASWGVVVPPLAPLLCSLLAAHQLVRNAQRLLAAVGLADEQLLDVDAQALQRTRTHSPVRAGRLAVLPLPTRTTQRPARLMRLPCQACTARATASRCPHLGVVLVKGMLCVHEAGDAPSLLHLGDGVQRQCRLARRFGPEDLQARRGRRCCCGGA